MTISREVLERLAELEAEIIRLHAIIDSAAKVCTNLEQKLTVQQGEVSD